MERAEPVHQLLWVTTSSSQTFISDPLRIGKILFKLKRLCKLIMHTLPQTSEQQVADVDPRVQENRIYIYICFTYIYICKYGVFCIKFVFSENINAKKG